MITEAGSEKPGQSTRLQLDIPVLYVIGAGLKDFFLRDNFPPAPSLALHSLKS